MREQVDDPSGPGGDPRGSNGGRGLKSTPPQLWGRGAGKPHGVGAQTSTTDPIDLSAVVGRQTFSSIAYLPDPYLRFEQTPSIEITVNGAIERAEATPAKQRKHGEKVLRNRWHSWGSPANTRSTTRPSSPRGAALGAVRFEESSANPRGFSDRNGYPGSPGPGNRRPARRRAETKRALKSIFAGIVTTPAVRLPKRTQGPLRRGRDGIRLPTIPTKTTESRFFGDAGYKLPDCRGSGYRGRTIEEHSAEGMETATRQN